MKFKVDKFQAQDAKSYPFDQSQVFFSQDEYDYECDDYVVDEVDYEDEQKLSSENNSFQVKS